MIWQDMLLAVGCYVLAFSLIPTVRGRSKPPRLTCLVYGTVLASFAAAFATLGLWHSSGGALAQAVMWVVILFQRRQ